MGLNIKQLHQFANLLVFRFTRNSSGGKFNRPSRSRKPHAPLGSWNAAGSQSPASPNYLLSSARRALGPRISCLDGPGRHCDALPEAFHRFRETADAGYGDQRVRWEVAGNPVTDVAPVQEIAKPPPVHNGQKVGTPVCLPSQVHTADGATAEYDAVVICTPLTDASISLPGMCTHACAVLLVDPAFIGMSPNWKDPEKHQKTLKDKPRLEKPRPDHDGCLFLSQCIL